jgi:two-component system, OmpR family, phosphate regulon sensor histidine kinase PhoR
MERILRYLNPLARLGNRKYSIVFPLFTTLAGCLLLEFWGNVILHNPSATGIFAIILLLGMIVYFSFRDGMRGGLIASVITIAYYFYIIITRNQGEDQLRSSIQTVLLLGLVYLFVAATVGGLKQKLDRMIEGEADEKRRLQAIIHQLPVGLVITNNKGAVVETNKQLENIVGVKIPIGYEMGKDDSLVKGEHGMPTWPRISPLVQSISTGRAVVRKDFVIMGPNNKKTIIQVSATPVKNKQGKVIAAVSIITDLTQQREMEKRKDDFVNIASHELKTPLTSMKLYIDSLSNRLKDQVDSKSMRTLKGIQYQTERLQDLVSDLLDVSRIQTGKLHFEKEKFSLDKMINETVEELQRSTKGQKIIYSKKTSITVNADKFRISQVMTNLLTNAIKYSPPDTNIVISTKKNGKYVFVSVQDQGLGIDKSEHKKIFERLYQVGDAKEKTYPGLGMGLYISKEIIKRHRGNIWVESEKGKGSKFFFSLPL